MTDMARQLLQELMGGLEDTGTKYTDHNICKDYLVDFCPNLLFVNTKADLGPCDLTHDDRLRDAYKKSPDHGRLGYEEAFYDRLQRLSHDLQRKVRRALDRITAEADEQLVNPHKEEKEERAIILDERIKQAMKKVQELGEQGHVLEAFNIYSQTDRLKSDLSTLKQRIDSINPMFKNEKRLEVCDVCGAFLVPNDASKRLDAHKEGKQHQGYIRIQKALEEHKQKTGSVRDQRDDRYSDNRHYSGSRRSRQRSGSAHRMNSRSPSPYQRHERRGYGDHSSSSGRYRDSSHKRRRDGRY
ncbi:splicing factor [Coemansia sp. RSA 1813]|nr:splicing factor [Coemansia sp. RSA 1646]KAJ1770316.1 splicing factor [Coemansia sp. RSA 1843]KAJ2091669.1 splicing factor [Coemansia sp. RSA 986]KAJ2216929.1 splicing factor [Coemansia sp. RSA 487]KAJ2571932.1 splicing factor [Coemansia sp. RSA 1813]